MNKTFDEILGSMLEAYQKGEKTLDQIIAEATAEAGFTEEDGKLLDEVNTTLDQIDAKVQSLDEAKAAGHSRAAWLSEEFEKATEGQADEDKIKVLEAVNNALEQRCSELEED